MAIWPVMLRAAAPDDAAALVEKTGIRGGLCLVIGAQDTSLTAALAGSTPSIDSGQAGSPQAGRSALYVQVLQPDAALAAQWGAAYAASTNREQIGVRQAAFDAEHYGASVFNLVVVEEAAALGTATPAELQRILVPGGVAAFRGMPPSFAAAAQALGASHGTAGAYAFSACRRSPWRGSCRWKPSGRPGRAVRLRAASTASVLATASSSTWSRWSATRAT